MIEPKPGLVQFTEHPTIVVPRWIRRVCFFARPILSRWSKKRDSRLCDRARALMGKCRQYKTREELESLLGPPRYSLTGHAGSVDGEVPDLIEYYVTCG
jgi:hypothetical protein